MRSRSPQSLALILSLSLICLAQAGPAHRTPNQEPTVKIGVTLVQVDAVVTDDHGNPVKDLKADDFEVFEDGHKQRISNFSFINAVSRPNKPRIQPASPQDMNAPYMPPPELRPDQVRRTIALVVDDLAMSGFSIVATRKALKTFVDEQMQPGDLVAILRTGGGMGALQQFTSDKRRLYAAIDHIVWNPFGGGGMTGVAPISAPSSVNPRVDSTVLLAPTLMSSGIGGDELRIADEFRQQIFTAGTLGALNYVVRGLTELPGRKSVVLLSDGFPIFYEHGRDTRLVDPLRELADLANRASVVVYTVDPRGLVNLSPSALDEPAFNPWVIQAQLNARTDAFIQTQEALRYLAAETGGLAVQNSNDIVKGLGRVMNDQNGYYLIGFIPDEKTFKTINGARAFHDVKVTVKRAGLHVRYHHGFYGVTDEEARSVPKTRGQQLGEALVSPFSSSAISVKLTSLFSSSRKTGPFVRSLVHIDPHNLTFSDEGTEWHKAVMDVAMMAFGDNGQVAFQLNKTLTVRARGDEYRDIMDRGLVYNINMPIKKDGAYQIRVAVRDANSKKIGSGSQFLNIPNVNKGRLALSGVVVQGSGSISQPSTSSKPGSTAQDRTQPSATAASRQEIAESHNASSDDNPAVRSFKPGEKLDLGFIIFNAKQDKATHKPNLHLQLRVFKDGDLVTAGPSVPFDAGQPSDSQRVGAGGSLTLNSNMLPGHYAVQVVCTDLLASEKHRTASAWMDFDIK